MKQLSLELEQALRSIYNTDDYIALHEPWFGPQDLANVSECITTGWVSSVGKFVDQFSEKICKYTGAKYAVPTVNGTAALHLALLANNIGPGQEVICPDLSFAATAAAIKYTGASIAFLDIDPNTLSLSHESLQTFLKNEAKFQNGKFYNKQTGRQITTVICMHNVGFSCELEELVASCKEYGLTLIEDAAEALGSTYQNKMCGTWGKAGIFSFNGNKTITSGGGGCLVTNDEQIFIKAKHLSTTAKIAHPYLYNHDEVGYNYRLPNLNASLACSQLDQLDSFIETKRDQFNKLSTLVSSEHLKWILPKQTRYNYWLNIAKINNGSPIELIEALAKKKIMARPLWSQLTKMPPYLNEFKYSLRNSHAVMSSYICLPNGVAKSQKNHAL